MSCIAQRAMNRAKGRAKGSMELGAWSLEPSPCCFARIARFAIHTMTRAKITTSIAVYAHACTAPKANGVARIREMMPEVKRWSQSNAKGMGLRGKS